MFSALTALFMPVFVWAQVVLSGTVRSNNQALPGATVSLNNFLTTQTNNSGIYSFGNLKTGKYLIKISYVGFKTIEQAIIVEEGRKQDFILEATTYMADEVLVRSIRANSKSATTYRNLDKDELEKNNLGQDLPYLLNQTPSAVVTSDAGAGIGYSGIRIRGSDPTRVNVTINGIPYNDTESQGTFFVNLPDFASSVDNIQVQRGVGTSTNGAGAFGGSINIQTTTRRDSAYAELNNSVGSFETWKNTVSAGTGVINNTFSLDGRLSRILSDGYIDRGASNLKSFFLSAALYGKNSLLRANVFSGMEKTYQAWNGVPQAMLESNRTYNGFTYGDQTDNYTQDHYQLLYSYSLSPTLSFNGALHLTKGKGYYEEFREDETLSSYGIAPVTVGSTSITESNLIRRRWLDNDFYGATYSLNYEPADNLSFSLGGAYNEYEGKHFGELIWAQYASTSTIRQRYYDGLGSKSDFNIYGKIVYTTGNLNLSADLQYRHTGYLISGTDKNRTPLNEDDQLNFFNPKVGLNYSLSDNNSLYASFAVANKEPNRDDYINSSTQPNAENLKDFEAGYRAKGRNFQAGINGFAMFYKDQLISTGKINDVGEYIRQNVHESYRIGAELDGKMQINSVLTWSATAALSSNRVKNFTSYDDDYDNGGQINTNFKNTRLAFSPSFVGSNEFSLKPLKNTEVALTSKYVGRQFLDNTSNSNRKIDPFFVNDLRLRYNFNTMKVKNIALTLLVNNVLAEKYETNGYTFSYLYGGAYTTENFYYPQAGRNFLLSLSVKF